VKANSRGVNSWLSQCCLLLAQGLWLYSHVRVGGAGALEGSVVLPDWCPLVFLCLMHVPITFCI
jgi:hypothetical protein